VVINKSIHWLHSNYKNLQQKYAGKYIAIFNEQIIAMGESFEETDLKAKLIVPDNKEYLIEFIERGDLYAYSSSISSNSSRS
jgi:hypothetical protein